ncbi:MAG: hypothetical protein PVF38_14865, partial [Desulfobacterales bacterium]
LSRTDLWGRGGEIPLRYPTQYLADIRFSRIISPPGNKWDIHNIGCFFYLEAFYHFLLLA